MDQHGLSNQIDQLYEINFSSFRFFKFNFLLKVKPNEVTIVKALQELLLPDWNNAFIVTTIGPKGIIIPKIREKRNWLVRHGHYRTEHRLPAVVMYDGSMTVKSLLRTEVSD